MTEKIADLASDLYDEHKLLAYGYHHNEIRLNALRMNWHENQLNAIQGEVQRFDDEDLGHRVKSLTTVSKANLKAMEADVVNASEAVSARLDEFIDHAVQLAALEGLKIIVKKPTTRKQPVGVGGAQDSLLD